MQAYKTKPVEASAEMHATGIAMVFWSCLVHEILCFIYLSDRYNETNVQCLWAVRRCITLRDAAEQDRTASLT